VKIFSNGFLSLFRVKVTAQNDALTSDELRAAVSESDEQLNTSHKDMLLRVLGMEKVTVEDVMVPRADMQAIDMDHPYS